MAKFVLNYREATDNKHHWKTVIDNASFDFYVPKFALPAKPPQQITVWVESRKEHAAHAPAKLQATVECVEAKGRTVRYRPVGDPKHWAIGEPYIPKAVLPEPYPEQLYVAVGWDETPEE